MLIGATVVAPAAGVLTVLENGTLKLLKFLCEFDPQVLPGLRSNLPPHHDDSVL